MKIIKVHAENFLSYEGFDLDINQGLCLISGYNQDDKTANGAGKTTLLDSIAFGLFGQLPRQIKVDEVINIQNKDKQCKVQITLEDSGRIFDIYRARNPNIILLTVNGQEIKAKDAKEMQKLIEYKLGITYQIFVNSVYFYQNALSHFVSATDNEKKDILTELLDLDSFDRAYTYTSDLIKIDKNKQSNIEGQLLMLTQQIQANEQDIEKYKDLSINFELLKQDEIKKVESDIAVNERMIADNNTNIDNILQKISHIDTIKLQEDNNKIESYINKQLPLITSNIGTIKEKKTLITYRQNQIIKGLDLLKKGQGLKCSKCFQTIPESHVNTTTEQFNKELLQIDDDLKNLDKEYEKALEVQKLIDDLNIKLKNNLYEISVVQIEQIKAESLKKDIQSNKSIIITSKKNIEDIKNRENTYDGICNEKIEANKNIKEQECAYNTQIQDMHNYINQLEFLKNCYRDVKYYVFESIVSELNTKINDYIASLFDTEVQIKFDTESKNYKGEKKLKFMTTIFKDNEARSFNSLSGGEKRRIELATNFALSDIIANRSNKTFNFMLLDECFEGLDSEGRSRIVDLLEVLKDKRENIFVIDHFESIKSMVDNEINVVKENGISRIL